MNFQPATRQGVKPIIALYGESGCGKTYSALMLGRGIVGPTGKLGMIDTESGRGQLYADVIPGSYQVLALDGPFHPARYVEAIEVAEHAGLGCLVIDSMSHEWEGIGGVLDMAGDIEERTKKPGLHCWKQPKLEHQKLVLKLLQSKLVIVVCLRAKYKSRQVKNNGRTEIVKDDHTSPIQAEDFIFEMTAHAEIMGNHTIRLTKCSHPELRKCFPKDGEQPLSVSHGEAIAAWASGKTSTDRRAEVPELLKSQGCASWKDANDWLKKQGILGQDETVQTSSPARIEEIIFAIKEVLA